ncbi:MAG TPA: class II fructose-bisphosphate aldolase [Candidatus Paceibacterota bacterium]
MTLRQTIADFKASKKALGHFNISDSNQLRAIAQAARETGLPVVVGLSEGERDFMPLSHVRAVVDVYRKEGIQMFLNADHTYSIEKARAAIDAGVDSIVIDGAKLPFDENVSLARSCVEYARASGRDVLVEGELGYIGQSSQVLDRLPEGAAITEEMLTKQDEMLRFIQETGVDMMAPAVGNVHGIVASGQPKLSIERIAQLAAASPVPLVLHGGSGSSEEEFRNAVAGGIAMIHINTELRLAYRHGIEHGLADMPREAAPYKFLAPAVADMAAYVAGKLRLFSGQILS